MELKEYFAPLLKWWWLILLSTAIAGISSYLATRQQPLLYRSATALMIGNAIENPNPSTSELMITQQLAAGYVNLAGRASVQEDVRATLGLNRLPDISVRQLNNTNIIEILVSDTDPVRAQAVATEMANQIILRSPTSQGNDQSFVNELLSSYESAIVETRDQLAAKQELLGTLTSAREIAQTQTEIATLEGSLRTMESNYATLLSSTQQGATNAIRVIEPAYLPRFPVNPNNTRTIAIAAGIGFVLAAAAAYVLEYLDDTVKTPTQVTKLTTLPVLAGIAEFKAERGGQLMTISQPRSPISEAFRILRTGIQFTAVDSTNHTVLITSATPGDGKSVIAANLSVVLAQAGHNVLLIDTDLRLPSQQTVFDLPNKRGLTSLLLEFDLAQRDEEIHLIVNDVVQSTQVEGLQLLTSGPIPPNPSELLGSKKMKKLLGILSEQYDYLILDSPPMLSVTDSLVLSQQVDGILLVVRANSSRKGQVKQAVEMLRDVRARLIGSILNDLPPHGEGYSTYYYYRQPYYGLEQSVAEPQTELGKLRKRFLRGQTKEAV